MAFFRCAVAAALPLLIIFASVGSTWGATLAQERMALLALKAAVKNPADPLVPNTLNSWVGSNVCDWQNVFCNAAGHVTTLNLLDLDPDIDENPTFNVTIGPTFAFLQNLQTFTVRLKGNPFPKALAALKQLTMVHVEGASGILPANVGNWTKMTDLTIRDGTLSGSIPASIGKLASLTNLELSWNKLTGPIPSTIGNLKKLKYFGVMANQLTGSLPSTIGNITGLQWLYVERNKLQGAIPSSFSQLKALNYVEMSFNSFSGAIPPSFAGLPKLIRFRATDNKFTGTVPAQLNKVWQAFLDNNFLTGTVSVIDQYHTYSNNCLRITSCKRVVTGQRPFQQCLAVYPGLRLPCVLS